MTRNEAWLLVASEECAELQQAISKALRFGMHNGDPSRPESTNELDILTEYVHLQSTMGVLYERRVLRQLSPQERIDICHEKRKRAEKYMAISERIGCILEEEEEAHWIFEPDVKQYPNELVVDLVECRCSKCILQRRVALIFHALQHRDVFLVIPQRVEVLADAHGADVAGIPVAGLYDLHFQYLLAYGLKFGGVAVAFRVYSTSKLLTCQEEFTGK